MYPPSLSVHIVVEQSADPVSQAVAQSHGAGLSPLLMLVLIGVLVAVVVRGRPAVRSQSRNWSGNGSSGSGSSGSGLPDHGLRREEFKKAAGTVLVTALCLVMVVRHFLLG
ncbi:MAG: hypothetical protein QG608_2774 [Actinomycetota bacterium]|nr:hypothetical protein [Actinomycetota bacterium]